MLIIASMQVQSARRRRQCFPSRRSRRRSVAYQCATGLQRCSHSRSRTWLRSTPNPHPCWRWTTGPTCREWGEAERRRKGESFGTRRSPPSSPTCQTGVVFCQYKFKLYLTATGSERDLHLDKIGIFSFLLVMFEKRPFESSRQSHSRTTIIVRNISQDVDRNSTTASDRRWHERRSRARCVL